VSVSGNTITLAFHTALCASNLVRPQPYSHLVLVTASWHTGRRGGDEPVSSKGFDAELRPTSGCNQRWSCGLLTYSPLAVPLYAVFCTCNQVGHTSPGGKGQTDDVSSASRPRWRRPACSFIPTVPMPRSRRCLVKPPISTLSTISRYAVPHSHLPCTDRIAHR